VGELTLILLIVFGLLLIYRGPRVLPRLGEMLGRGVRDARHAARERLGRSGEDDRPPA
jgi:Sec-independent protein translocase protein TatA